MTTTGALVVCRTLLASAKPMPREAGDIKDHGGMLDVVNRSFCYHRIMLQPIFLRLVLDTIDDGILAMPIGYAVSGLASILASRMSLLGNLKIHHCTWRYTFAMVSRSHFIVPIRKASRHGISICRLHQVVNDLQSHLT